MNDREDMALHPSDDRAAGLRPQPPAASSQSSIPSAEERGCRCQVCARRFRVDVLVPDDLWDIVRPAGRTGGGGLLCGSCIIARLDEALSFSAFRLEVITAATPFSFAWSDDESLAGRAIALVRSMASVKCKNKYPVGVIGREARAHYDEARRIASGMSASGQDAKRLEAKPASPTGEAGDAKTPQNQQDIGHD